MRTIRSVALVGALALAGPSAAGAAGAGEEPAGRLGEGVDCAWTCYCARRLEDCDSTEWQYDICKDTRATRQRAASCDACRQAAAQACAARTCPPDPAKGPKHVLSYTCDGERHYGAEAAEGLGAALEAAPSVAAKPPADILERLDPQPEGKGEDAAAAVSCRFACACQVAVDMCDRREVRTRLCSDKQERTLRAATCGTCRVRAHATCRLADCPLGAGLTKVMTRFACPAS